MAQKTVINLIDDYDGSVAEETVSFSLDGVDWEIDLNGTNAQELRDGLAGWIEAARRVGGRRTHSTGSNGSSNGSYNGAARKNAVAGFSPDERNAIQRFAQEQGLRVPADRGRIAASVLEAFRNAGSPGSRKSNR